MSIVTSEILQRVLAISPDEKSMGSCFAYPINGTYCFITAAHVLGDCLHSSESTLFLNKSNKWNEIKVVPYYASGRPYQDGDIDVAIVKTRIAVENRAISPLALDSGGAALGQEAYFLGFPYFGSITYNPEVFNSNFPMPFVKKATLSAFNFKEGTIYLDGHNNPGFSGGPLVFWNHLKKQMQIAGVVSSYVSHVGEVRTLPTSTSGIYYENSGIGVAFNISHAQRLIGEVYGDVRLNSAP